MRIKQISITEKGKKLSISWYSGEEDNTLNTVSGTDKPLPSFKEACQKRPCVCRRWHL